MKWAPESRAWHARVSRHTYQPLWLGPHTPGGSQLAALVSAPSPAARLHCSRWPLPSGSLTNPSKVGGCLPLIRRTGTCLCI